MIKIPTPLKRAEIGFREKNDFGRVVGTTSRLSFKIEAFKQF